MRTFVRKFLLFYISAMLCVAPMAAEAASKKTHKHISSSSKYKVVKYKTGSRKVQHRLRASKSAVMVDSYDGNSPLRLASAKALVINQQTGEIVYAKNTNIPTPIASVTKLMTAMVMLDAHLPLDELVGLAGERRRILDLRNAGFAMTGDAHFGLLLAGGDVGGVDERSAGHHHGEQGPG